MSGLPHHIYWYWRDVRDADWDRSDLVWGSICGVLLIALVAYLVCWACGDCG